MIPVVHPLTLTSQQLRRSAARLEQFIRQNGEIDFVKDGTVQEILQDVNEAYRKIPKELRK